MDYEKNSSENTAVRAIMRMIEDGEITQEVAKKYYPELVESEDERIRKALIEGIKICSEENILFTKEVSKSKVLSWLEKQGQDGKVWFYRDDYVRDKKQAYQDGIDNVLNNPQKYGLEKREIKEHDVCDTCDEKASCINPCPTKLIEEQNPAWSEEDEAVLDALIRRLEGEDIHVSPHLAVKCLKSLKDRVLPQPKQEWSEEDKEMLSSIAENCPEKVYVWVKRLRSYNLSKEERNFEKKKPSEDDIKEAIRTLEIAAEDIEIPEKYKNTDWLKSLKDRIQPKQEWSEKDERMLTAILRDVMHGEPLDKLQYDWLKSLKPQNTWKPSDEQMKALDIAICCGIQLGAWEEDALKSLTQQLKKLKDEED